MKKKRKELEVKIVPCFLRYEKGRTFDSKVRVVRKPKVCKEFWVYLSFEQGKRRKDRLCV